MLKYNLEEIRENMALAADKSGRSLEDITLVGVTKTIDTDSIKEACDLGVLNFGENRVQEFLPKFDKLKPESIKWHMIGQLQTNKVKAIIDKVCLIHSVDSLRLAEEISKRAAQIDINMDILLEINIAAEDTKIGIKPQEAKTLTEQVSFLPNVTVRGLMCIAPYVENPEKNRGYFDKMHRLFVDMQLINLHNVNINLLSMGMTGDYQIAIEEGANIVRIGTGLFGRRNYS